MSSVLTFNLALKGDNRENSIKIAVSHSWGPKLKISNKICINESFLEPPNLESMGESGIKEEKRGNRAPLVSDIWYKKKVKIHNASCRHC